MTHEIEAAYEVVTPTFCGGADQDRAELRAPSFKGVLRFWWRALAWSRLGGNLKEIKRQEEQLFGSADTGRSRVSMRLDAARDPSPARVGDVLKVGGRTVKEGARYLGYGVMEAFASRKTGKQAGQLTRACLRAPIPFKARMRVRTRGGSPESREGQLKSLVDALVCLGTHGGMGAKSRKGYGSINLRSLVVNGATEWRGPTSAGDLYEAIADLRQRAGRSGLPEYTALGRKSRHLLVTSTESGSVAPMDLLNRVGCELVRYRSWGHNGKVLGQQSERNFKPDHDLMKGTRRTRHPERIAFGLPHNYGRGRNQMVGPADSRFDRRASPLFIHMHQCGDTPVAVLSFLPARFLPAPPGDSPLISVGKSKVHQKPERELYRPIHDFLDRLRDGPKEPLRAEEVTP